jgi:sphingomyelin phosphodiesterase acid-like 3
MSRSAPEAWVRAFCLGVAAFVAFALSATARGEVASASFLMVSDLHFNPMAEPPLVDRLAATEPGEWRAIFEGTGSRSPSRYGADTNWPLLRSALQQMKETLPHPAFLLLPGDFLAHHFRAQFDAAARDHSDSAYRGFVVKTMRFLADEIVHTFPNTPVLPVLGNNDAECGDFRLQPNGPFLADTLPILRGLVGGNGKPGFDQSWTSYGNYSAILPGTPGVSIVFLNTVVFSRNYRNSCGSRGGPDPGRQTLAWLAASLAAARQAHERVWLVYHIPPGVDGYRTWRQGTCPDTIVPMWDDAYARPFFALLRRYSDTVIVNFAGHTHMDDFRLIGDDKGDYSFALIMPALSPIFGQNPAFRTVALDASGGIVDQTTYDLANLAEAGPAIPPKWQVEYTFSREWHLPRVDLPSLERLYAMITTVPADRARWHALFAVSSPVYWGLTPGGSAAHTLRAYGCATGHVRSADFEQCWCGGAK